MAKSSGDSFSYLKKLKPLYYKGSTVLKTDVMGVSSCRVEPTTEVKASTTIICQGQRIPNANLNNSTRSESSGYKKVEQIKRFEPEQICKVVCSLILALVVLASGLLARITVHVMFWQLNPPTNSTMAPDFRRLGGLIRKVALLNETTDCCYISGMIATEEYDAYLDEKWIWALFLVVVVPYAITTISTFFRILFKSNYPLKFRVTVPYIILEIVHAFGVALMAFLVLPAMDPISASVCYLSIQTIPLIIRLYDKLRNMRNNKGRKVYVSLMRIVTGNITYLVGCILISIYLSKEGWVSAAFIISSIMSSVRYWENFVQIGNEKSGNCLLKLKYELHVARTKNTFIANIFKILSTLVVVIAIFTIKAKDSTLGIKALFGDCVTTIESLGETILFGESDKCVNNVPFLVATVNICCSYICYKSAKIICAINCQIIGFSIPLILVPIVSTITISGILTNPSILQFGSYDLLDPNFKLQDVNAVGNNARYIVIAFVFLMVSLLATTFHVWKSNGYRHGETSRLFVAPFYCGVFSDLSLLFNRRRHDTEYSIRTMDQEKIKQRKPKIYACATLWHESETEMSHLLSSIFRLDKEQVENVIREKGLQNTKKNEQEELGITSESLEGKIGFCCPTRKNGKENVISEESVNEGYDLEAHLFVDDALIVNGNCKELNCYAKVLVKVVHSVWRDAYQGKIKQRKGDVFSTPYGAKIEWQLPGKTILAVHLKNKAQVKTKKRWSQIMYMNYILKWKIEETYENEKRLAELNKGNGGFTRVNCLANIKLSSNAVVNIDRHAQHKKIFDEKKQKILENTFLLTLDGDVEFNPGAVTCLLQRMRKSGIVGAACGRIHPVGKGPMIWYQKFEYAISHWLQKATEHVIGCVLCGPGCFSLFRASAVLNKKVLNHYSSVPSEAKQVLQYDQGEDRWLCTLLLKLGWRIEYCAEADACTFGPTGFYEFFGQRRRWVPSTLANSYEIITECKTITRNNENISYLYIVYQIFLMISTLLTPGTIFMLIVGALIIGFESVPPWLILTLNIVPVGIFALMTIFTTKERQLQFAALLSSVYIVVMVIAMIGVVRDSLIEGLCSVTTIAVIFETGVILLSALLHPKECLCLFAGIVYFLAIPATSMLMFFYSIANLNENSWGTREQLEHKTHTHKKGYVFSFGNFFKCICCPNSPNDGLAGFHDDEKGERIKMAVQTNHRTDEETKENKKTKKSNSLKVYEHTYQVKVGEKRLPTKEELFWRNIIAKLLTPDRQRNENSENHELMAESMEEQLTTLRNYTSLFVFLLNAILVTIMFSLTQVNAFSNLIITVRHSDECVFKVDPIAVLFILNFGILLLIQFLCMLYHRASTLIHILANTVIFESATEEQRKEMDKMIHKIVSPEMPVPQDHTAGTDKEQQILDDNRIMETDELQYENLEEMAMDHLNTIKCTSRNENRIKLVVEALKGASSVRTRWKLAVRKIILNIKENETSV